MSMIHLGLFDAAELAALLESAIQRLGQLGQPGVDALAERLAMVPNRMDFDAGVDLLDHWISDQQASAR